MRLARTVVLLVPLAALAMVAAGSASEQRAALSTAPVSCPKGVLAHDSVLAPIADVLQGAQGLLARKTINSQGTVYHLTPRNAPIDLIERLATSGKADPVDQRIPGLALIRRAAISACGEEIAQASWAIHYDLPVSVIASQGASAFLVKTRTGWRFWGNWCGAGNTRQWRNTYCK